MISSLLRVYDNWSSRQNVEEAVARDCRWVSLKELAQVGVKNPLKLKASGILARAALGI